MNRLSKIAVCCASGLILNTGLCASYGSSPKTPYEPIVARNIFGLNPPKTVAPKAPEPPSKITPDGIMTIFGTPQVLFKAWMPPHPPKPAKEKSYILSVGQGQDGIEVKHIDEKTGVITFNNHGVVQEIPLVKASPITTPTPVVMHRGGPPRAVAFRGFRPPGGASERHFGNQPGQNNTGNPSGNPNGNSPGGNYGTTGFGNVGSTTGGSAQKPLTPEEQMVMIAAEKAHLKETGNPTWRIYPPTSLDQDAGTVNSSSGTPSSP